MTILTVFFALSVCGLFLFGCLATELSQYSSEYCTCSMENCKYLGESYDGCGRQMMLIRSVQIELNNMGAVIKALPHLARPSDRTAKEVLSFVCIMLFNANEEIQVCAELHVFYFIDLL